MGGLPCDPSYCDATVMPKMTRTPCLRNGKWLLPGDCQGCNMNFGAFFFPSSAIIEHTNRVIFLEDDDIAAVADGKLSIHRVKRSASDDPSRAIQTLQMELQQIMKGRCPPRVPVQLP